MTPEHFLQLLQHQTSSFAQTVSTNEGEWIIKGFIDIHKKVWFFVTWYGSIGGHKSTKSLSGKRLN
ncbi:MAG: hypothetical protein GPI90_23810 [Microcystis aeruginosa K13-05]|jgi:hypothetical protein|uniref:Uncharacterized protein n=1 Tax=Microcystis aeruginosa PCC 9717 TaxID=1160286 RepID=I4FMB0_MICAE|nr:hypothetical protein [Microcystis aeruginosa]MCZ8049011.1 hypothetical protein [Microcystis sp. LE19-41.2A]MCZ8288486.1 hypothetical protein [Microcystis sp. LE19-59.1C]NCR82760.1 hypothetical protein [Microcystis aeruginosa K13-10]NCR87442.1 hypothetical protein [Microcystis aeruginosa K13-05]CCH96785.1 hypothetical protein MICAB_2590007 [Microcystis aeruginosa PCC 9717]